MRVGLLIILAFWCLPVSSQTLEIMGSDEGFLPFYYGDNLNKGILVEVINEFSLEAGITAGFCQPVVDAATKPDARRRTGVNLA